MERPIKGRYGIRIVSGLLSDNAQDGSSNVFNIRRDVVRLANMRNGESSRVIAEEKRGR